MEKPLKHQRRLGLMNLVTLDFSKAFDRVPHQRLLKKTHGLIMSFLPGQTQQVIVDGATSEKAPVISGVPQGTVLGPLFFLLFINNLPDCVISRTRLFADACIVYWNIQTLENCIKRQWDLVSLAQWESFHPDKCNMLQVTKKRTPLNSI